MTRVFTWFWVAVSATLHALLIIAPLVPPLPERAAGAALATTWVEAVAPPPKPPPVAPPPPPPPPEKPKRVPAKPAVSTPAATEPQPEPEGATGAAEPAVAVESQDGTLAIAQGTGTGGTGEGSGSGDTGTGTGSGSGPPSPAPPERKLGPAQLSLWMDIPQLTSMALVRSGIGLLMSVPGYADTLRGSGIRPFADLERLRIRMTGVAPERLTVAGVHSAGEQSLLAAAGRVAAMRNRQPVWRGDDDLRATSWVDGSGVDRGLAVHRDAFLISARDMMPDLLGGDDPATRVPELSRMRRGVAMLLTVEDANRYLPGVDACALQALRLSVGGGGGSYRMVLTADYRAQSFASQASVCLRALQGSATQLSSLVQWLERAQSAPGSYSTTLTARVTSDDVEHLLNELAWALRSSRRG